MLAMKEAVQTKPHFGMDNYYIDIPDWEAWMIVVLTALAVGAAIYFEAFQIFFVCCACCMKDDKKKKKKKKRRDDTSSDEDSSDEEKEKKKKKDKKKSKSKK